MCDESEEMDFMRLINNHSEKELSKDEIIQFNKKYTQVIKTARDLAKPTHCLLCGKKCSSFCNSHTIPQFILKSISDNGKYFNINTILKVPGLKQNVGLNEANTFRLICNECDKKFFSKYEDPLVYDKKPNQRIMAEIALKNSLRMIWKRSVETETYAYIEKQLPNNTLSALNAKKTQDVNQFDLKEFQDSVKRAIKTIDEKIIGYYLIDYFTLDYITQIAYQGEIALVSGFDEELINDIYSNDIKYKIQSLHICVFPIVDKTCIFLFIEDGDRRYSRFYKKYQKLSIKEKLEVLNYLIVKYSEEWLLTNSIDNQLLDNENFKKIISTTTNPMPGLLGIYEDEKDYKQLALEKAVKTFAIKNFDKIHNFLSPIVR